MFIKRGETNWKYILILVILAVIIGGGILVYQYFWLSKEEKPLEIVTPKIPPKETPEIPADWKTYQNEEYGFEIKYPEDSWEVGNLAEHPFLEIKGEVIKTKVLHQTISIGPISVTEATEPLAFIWWYKWEGRNIEEFLENFSRDPDRNCYKTRVGFYKNYESIQCLSNFRCEFGYCNSLVENIIQRPDTLDKLLILLSIGEEFEIEKIEFKPNWKTYSPIYFQILSTFKFI